MRELDRVEVNVVSGGAPEMTDHPVPVLEPPFETIPDFNPPVDPA